jgi:heat shock protein HslJ
MRTIIIGFLVLSGFNLYAQTKQNTPENILGNWQLSVINRKALPKKLAYGLTLRIEKNQFSGSGGCNSFSSNFTAGDGVFQAGKTFSITEKACKHEILQQEKAYIQLLSTVDSYSIKGHFLILKLKGKEKLKFLKLKQ